MIIIQGVHFKWTQADSSAYRLIRGEVNCKYNIHCFY